MLARATTLRPLPISKLQSLLPGATTAPVAGAAAVSLLVSAFTAADAAVGLAAAPVAAAGSRIATAGRGQHAADYQGVCTALLYVYIPRPSHVGDVCTSISMTASSPVYGTHYYLRIMNV